MLAAALLSAVIAQASPAPSPSPCPSASPLATHAIKTISCVTAHGRKQNLVGKVDAASTGTIDQQEIATRPILRPGEVLEAIPGLVITQHSGGGKANQYYLRGFQLDHGTDLESSVVGTPVNLPTHAHGQGYSDINWLIPELVSYVQFKKGPYYADQGDFSTAGAYNLFYRNTIAPSAEYTIGGFGYDRVLLANSPRVGAGNLLYALEYVHDNSTLDRPDDYRKYNGVLRYSVQGKHSDFAVTGMAYSGVWDSSDQIPARLVDSGAIDRLGLVDPSDGGSSYRFALSAQLNRSYEHGALHATVYAFKQYLDLFSNFTYFFDDANDYYNVTSNPITCSDVYTTCSPGAVHAPAYTSYCPGNNFAPPGAPAHSVTPGPFAFSCGDQREQQDKRFVSGFDVSRDFQRRNSRTTVGVALRNDNIAPVALFLTHDRVRYPNGTLSDAHAVETDLSAYAQSDIHLGRKLRVVPGLRADLYSFNIGETDPANSGVLHEGILSPKISAAYTISPNQEAYLDYGESFHSNDGRGATETHDPQTHAIFDPTGAPVTPVTPLVRASGEEAGYRFSNRKFNSTISLWQLDIASELIFDGDHGVTFAGRPTRRRGIELANFFTPTPHLTIDADLATSSARFLTDPDRIGTDVPESLAAVISAGATVDEPYYDASLRMRYFGPRDLSEDGSATSPPSTIFNAQFTAKLRARRLSLQILNILNAQAADVTYYYGSWLRQDAANPAYAANAAVNPALGGAGVNDYHFHPSEVRTFRLTVTEPL